MILETQDFDDIPIIPETQTDIVAIDDYIILHTILLMI